MYNLINNYQNYIGFQFSNNYIKSHYSGSYRSKMKIDYDRDEPEFTNKIEMTYNKRVKTSVWNHYFLFYINDSICFTFHLGFKIYIWSSQNWYYKPGIKNIFYRWFIYSTTKIALCVFIVLLIYTILCKFVNLVKPLICIYNYFLYKLNIKICTFILVLSINVSNVVMGENNHTLLKIVVSKNHTFYNDLWSISYYLYIF